jgi:glycosyltransferase involved in cell wall biosynthesis
MLCEVAVVVPTYNAADYIARAVDSVLSQTDVHFSLCVIDDGSTDETASIMERYSGRLAYYRQAHAGQAAARNRGIRMSSSIYVAFLDADDYWLPEKLQRQVALLEQNPKVGLVCSDCGTIAAGRIANTHFETNAVPRAGMIFDRLALDCFIFTPTVMVRRACLDEVGLFNQSLSVSEDFNLWLRIAARWQVAVIPEVLAVREMRAEGLSLSTPPEVYLENGIAALEDVRAVCTELSPQESSALQAAIAERYYVYGSHLLASGQYTQSRKKLASALTEKPAHWRAWTKYGLSLLPGAVVRRLTEARRGFVPTLTRI